MRELVEFLAKSVVTYPDRVRVDEVNKGRTILYEVRVAEEDMGKVIGRHGRVIQAIRTVVKAAATRTGEYVQVEVPGQQGEVPGAGAR